MRKNLTRRERLFKNSDILKMLRNAKKVEFCDIKLLYYPNYLKWNRIAVLLKKGFSSAVKRNREKRIVKECYKSIKNYIYSGLDIILLISPVSYSYLSRFSQIVFLFRKAALLDYENI